jgi:hypothetical protein
MVHLIRRAPDKKTGGSTAARRLGMNTKKNTQLPREMPEVGPTLLEIGIIVTFYLQFHSRQTLKGMRQICSLTKRDTENTEGKSS